MGECRTGRGFDPGSFAHVRIARLSETLSINFVLLRLRLSWCRSERSESWNITSVEIALRSRIGTAAVSRPHPDNKVARDSLKIDLNI